MRQTRITPEARFVTLATREQAPDCGERIRQAGCDVSDWDEAVRLAIRHGVATFVRDTVTSEGIAVPGETDAALNHVIRGSVVRGLRLFGGLRQAIRALTAAGVTPMILKGPVLARTIYRDPTFRPFGDIDLNVQEGDESRAVEALLSLGYVEAIDVAEARYREYAGHSHDHGEYHRQFVSFDRQMMVELHTDPLQLGLRPTCEIARWRRAIPAAGLPDAVMLCPEDQVVQLSVHVHKHGFERLIWLKDLDLLLRAYRDTLDWRVVEDVARSEGVRASVWYTLWLTSRLLATPIPRTARDRLRPSPIVRALYRFVWPPTQIENLGGQMHRRAVQVRGADSWRGVLPSLVLMGRRRDRARAALHVLGWR